MYACQAGEARQRRSQSWGTQNKRAVRSGLTLVIWLPLHPSLEHLPRACDVLKQLLEVDKLEPHLIHPGEQCDRSVVQVPGVLDVSRFQLLRERRAETSGRERDLVSAREHEQGRAGT